MVFSDEDLRQLKELVEEKSMWPLELKSPKMFIALIARLEAAERVLTLPKRFQYDDGLVMYDINFGTPEIVSLMDAWRKASGKTRDGEGEA